jgi:hypothetical protein
MIAEEIAGRFAGLPYVQAVVLSGSRTSRVDDGHSDFDIYVYTPQVVPPAWRMELARPHGSHIAIDNNYWEAGDDWIDTRTGREVDIMYRSPDGSRSNWTVCWCTAKLRPATAPVSGTTS